MTIRNLRDIEALEAQPLAAHRLPSTSYEAIAATAARTPDAKALSFFVSADALADAFVWTYAELLADVTRAANAFHELGVTAENPAAFVLPNLPDTHFVIWGGETAGAVLAINPYFEPAQIAGLLKSARARVLVTLAPNPAMDLWSKLAPHLTDLPDLKTVALVDAMVYVGAGPRNLSAFTLPHVDVIDFRERLRAQPGDRLLRPPTASSEAICSYFCTGGTTGRRKSPCGLTGTRSLTPGARRRCSGRVSRRAPPSAACPCSMSTLNSSRGFRPGCGATTSCLQLRRATAART